MGCGMSTEYQEDEKEKKAYPAYYPYTTKATMSSGLSTVDYQGDEEDPLILPGSQYGSTWQHQPMYQPIYEPESQPIIPIQETDSTYKVTLSTYCSACRLKAQGTKCSDQFGNAWMLERLVSVSPAALQQAVNTQVYGMKELQKHPKYNPNINLRIQLRGDFCAYFGNPQGHSRPEKYVEAVVQEAWEDEEDRSLSPCRLVRDMMSYGIKCFQTWEGVDGRGRVFFIQPRL